MVMTVDAPAVSVVWLRRESHQPPIWIKADADALAPARGRGCGPGESAVPRHVHVDGRVRGARGQQVLVAAAAGGATRGGASPRRARGEMGEKGEKGPGSMYLR